jgi:nucleoside-diphosphate-sugar epimerase
MILVTGGAGRLGRQLVQALLSLGRDVKATDSILPKDSIFSITQANLCDWDQTIDLLDGVEAVIHMGAIPGPHRGPPRWIFENNMISTFNLFSAAAEVGVRRLVFSSSAFAMGWSYDPMSFIPKYLPLDEEHPMTPFEPYGLSKQLGEYVAQMFTRKCSMSVVSLRFTNVVLPNETPFPWDAPSPSNPTTLVMWAYSDARDVVEAHIRALDAPIEGHEALLLAQPITRFLEPTVELIRSNFGPSVKIKGDLIDNASVISCNKSQRILGWIPEYTWMDP